MRPKKSSKKEEVKSDFPAPAAGGDINNNDTEDNMWGKHAKQHGIEASSPEEAVGKLAALLEAANRLIAKTKKEGKAPPGITMDNIETFMEASPIKSKHKDEIINGLKPKAK